MSALAWFLLRAGTRVTRFRWRGNRPRGDAKQYSERRVWIDVGAHRGETTFDRASRDPSIVVYAFEPDVAVATHKYGLLENFVVIPMAVSGANGFREFHVNSNDRTSSLLELNRESLSKWKGTPNLRTVRHVLVPTIRLDSFLDMMEIDKVDYLKIDAQGHDLEVVESLGERIHDVAELKIEACAVSDPLYRGSRNRVEDVKALLQRSGFILAESLPESLGQERNLVFAVV
jgi:FkbM family methyltransferase